MNQVVHIFRKDCRHLWSYISAVLVLTFLNGYGEVVYRGGVVAGLSPTVVLMILAGLSRFLLPIALFLLVASVIQEEGLVGSDKFWLTRPYSRRSLFLEKLLFILVWAVLPMLLHDVVLIRHFGFPLTSAFGLLLWKSAQFGLFLLFAAALAVLSASFGRAIVLGFVAILIALLTFLVVFENPGHSIVAVPSSANYVLRALLAVAALGALAVVAFQYRFRIAPVAAVLGVIAILACALLVRFWPQSLTAYLSPRNASPLLDSVQIRPDASLKDLPRPRLSQDDATQKRTAYYPFRAEGMPDNVGFDLGMAAEFETPGQKAASVYLPVQVRFQPPAAGSERFPDAGGPDQLVPFAMSFGGDFERLKDADGTLAGKVFLEGFRTSVTRMSVPPPMREQDFTIADRRCKVQSYRRDHNLALVFDCVELEPGDITRFQARLLANGQVMIPSQSQGDSSNAGSWPAFLSPMVRTDYRCEFTLPEAVINEVGESTGGLEMLVYAEQSAGQQQRDFRIEHFRPGEFGLQSWEQRGALRSEQ